MRQPNAVHDIGGRATGRGAGEPAGDGRAEGGRRAGAQCFDTTDATGELPLYRPDTYAEALASGTVPGPRSA
ncbi:hypothetical protein ABZ887_46280, partial [Streptomyces sp. NPDC047061]